jgi:hypothetical protein
MTQTLHELIDDIAAEKNADQNFQALTAAGAITAGTSCVTLSKTGGAAAFTIADAKNHGGFFYIINLSGDTSAHTVTLTTGTWNGTNTIATFNAANEALWVFFDSTTGNGYIITNTGSVGLS